MKRRLNHHHRKCPNCNRELFIDPGSLLEKLAKLIIATVHLRVIVLAAILLSGTAHPYVAAVGGILFALCLARVLAYRRNRRENGSRWWVHFADPEQREVSEFAELAVMLGLDFLLLWLSSWFLPF